jgi:hypothetical protein
MDAYPAGRTTQLLVLLGVLVGVLLVSSIAHPAPAQSHLVDFSEPGETHDLYTPANSARCIFGPGNCAAHSWSH